MLEDNWETGLCREFAKATKYLIQYYKNPNDYDYEGIGVEIVKLHREMFEELWQ